eukprot:scaffold7380_cov240-Pinguiococcus_pyrenoidosus.AAC.3
MKLADPINCAEEGLPGVVHVQIALLVPSSKLSRQPQVVRRALLLITTACAIRTRMWTPSGQRESQKKEQLCQEVFAPVGNVDAEAHERHRQRHRPWRGLSPLPREGGQQLRHRHWRAVALWRPVSADAVGR